ncbi:hypothetical protein Y032_0085g1857 [Ancylostoma ceylanicum]|uniref:Uncharacterized protein n=1 Tax=Ancylostoma ceylanicum TaxID=53326 RepID=A0A016TQ58_9BILA|nr:hypothetical protein Y032_0085g1857 [Ancylostoma ceylanicum]
MVKLSLRFRYAVYYEMTVLVELFDVFGLPLARLHQSVDLRYLFHLASCVATIGGDGVKGTLPELCIDDGKVVKISIFLNALVIFVSCPIPKISVTSITVSSYSNVTVSVSSDNHCIFRRYFRGLLVK